jgi:hypothetical protein
MQSEADCLIVAAGAKSPQDFLIEESPWRREQESEQAVWRT